jgi:tetratricopeptide (TPR) repeat protein
MNKLFYFAATAIVASAGLFSIGAQAQSVTTLGTNDAYRCFESAEYAVRSLSGSVSDIVECNEAIREGRLSRRDKAATYINRGIIRVNMGDIARAQQDYLSALDISDRSPETFINLGNLQYMMQDYSSAISDYDHAESLGLTQRHVLFLNRGMAYMRVGQFDIAEAEYLKALEVRPDWLNAQDKLADLVEKRADAATEAAERAAAQ